MFQDVRTIQNPGTTNMTIWLEPWAFDYSIAPGETLQVTGSSAQEGRFEVVDYDGKVGFYGWPGSSVQVFLDGNMVDEHPALFHEGPPSGMSLRQFIEDAFGGPGGIGECQ